MSSFLKLGTLPAQKLPSLGTHNFSGEKFAHSRLHGSESPISGTFVSRVFQHKNELPYSKTK